jgi:hypothetical protein
LEEKKRMKLSKQDADLFFRLMWSLQYFVNLELGILPEITTVADYQKLPTAKKLNVRDALFDHIELVDPYRKVNPQNLSAEELEIIRSWKKFRRGDFFVERLLKKYAVFIGGDQVYAVLALRDPFQDVIPPVSLPYYVKAVLLPFKGKIIYDGMLQGYRVSFGRGIKYDLKETYMAAKQNGRIIESLDPTKQAENAVVNRKPGKDYSPTMDEISQQAKTLRSSRNAPAIYSPAFRLTKAGIAFAKLAVEDSDDIDGLRKALKKVENAIRRVETVLDRAER